MQFLKKFNLKKISILSYAIYSFLVWVLFIIFNIYFDSNIGKEANTFLNIIEDIKNFLSPFLFVSFLIIYLFICNTINIRLIRLLGISSVIISFVYFCKELISNYLYYFYNKSFNIDSLVNIIPYNFIFFIIKIGLVLFILTKFKKSMFVVYSIGLFSSVWLDIEDIIILNKYVRFGYFYNIFVCIDLIGFIAGILIWFYFFLEIKNKKKQIENKEIKEKLEENLEEQENEQTENYNSKRKWL